MFEKFSQPRPNFECIDIIFREELFVSNQYQHCLNYNASGKIIKVAIILKIWRLLQQMKIMK